MIFDLQNNNLIEYAYYIAPDSTATNGVQSVQYPLFGGSRVLLEWQDVGMPNINYIQDQGPFQNGVTVRDFRLQPRIITLTLYERGLKRNDFYKNEADIINKIRPNRSSTQAPGRLLLIQPDNTEIEINARILEGPSGNWDGQGGIIPSDFREELRFFCADPVWRLTNATNITFEPETGDSCLDTCLDTCLVPALIAESQTIAYTGTWDGDQITITITGPLALPQINNNTTGKTIALNYTVSAGETVTITILPETATIVNNLGVNLLGVADNLSDLTTFVLATEGDLTPDGNNSIGAFGTDATVGTSQIVFSYFTRHISAFTPS